MCNFKLAVKGLYPEASAAFYRRFPLGKILESSADSTARNTTLLTVSIPSGSLTPDGLPADTGLARWFCEPGECHEGFGYPPGSLLHYGSVS